MEPTFSCRNIKTILFLMIVFCYAASPGFSSFTVSTDPARVNNSGQDNGFDQTGHDGENLTRSNSKTQTSIPVKRLVKVTKHKWEDDEAGLADRLKMYLSYSRMSLLRRVRPSVSLLQTSPSSTVSCHATGFYPDRATVFWRKDGKRLYQDVDHGEILPNQDGTFQMTVDLDISSVKPEDWRRYDCVFQLYGAKNETMIIILDKKKHVRTKWDGTSVLKIITIALGLVLVATGIAGRCLHKEQ